jgi:uncharacterized protein (DUF2236 family)
LDLSSEKNFGEPRERGALSTAVGPRSVAWKIHREKVLLLGWGRAILLQLAHPLVAQGVADHSVFISRPKDRLRRLRSTIDSMLALTFGNAEAAGDAVRRINAIHDRVHGELHSSTDAFATGTKYSARDAALLGWVHATLLDSFILTYERCVAPLTPEEKDSYCRESSSIEPLLGIPAGYLPRTVCQLQKYMERMIASHQVEVNETARALAKEVLYPGVRWPLQPPMLLLRLFTLSTLPPPIREAYGLRCSLRQEKALTISVAIIRRLLSVTPSVLKHWKIARMAGSTYVAHGSRVDAE